MSHSLKILDVIFSLEEPDAQGECDGEIKQADSSQKQASLEHFWPEFNRMADAYFLESVELIEKTEIKILRELGLPDIDQVREAYLLDEEPGETGSWEFTGKRQEAYKGIIKEFLITMTGTAALKSATLMTDVMPYTEAIHVDSFGMAVNKYKKVFKKKLPKSIDPAFLDQVVINLRQDNPRIAKLYKTAAKRMRKKVVKENYRGMVKTLLDKVKTRKSPMQAAKLLHKSWGGDLAYWNRLVRSEMVLAQNEAYKEWTKKAVVLYSVWHSQAGCCALCSFFDGCKWLINENPWPVSDTHPHCQCVIEPSWEILEGESIRDRWDRRTPYEQAMSKEELEAWRRWYGKE
jgi:hypothetical protein